MLKRSQQRSVTNAYPCNHTLSHHHMRHRLVSVDIKASCKGTRIDMALSGTVTSQNKSCQFCMQFFSLQISVFTEYGHERAWFVSSDFKAPPLRLLNLKILRLLQSKECNVIVTCHVQSRAGSYVLWYLRSRFFADSCTDTWDDYLNSITGGDPFRRNKPYKCTKQESGNGDECGRPVVIISFHTHFGFRWPCNVICLCGNRTTMPTVYFRYSSN